MKNTLLKYLFTVLLFTPAITLFAQPSNYWSTSFNSEATMLGGAVVGGGSGITSIYFNPAGISEIENNNIALNTSMLTLLIENYSNAFGKNEDYSYYSFNVLPRFFTYLFRSKKYPKLSWQFALFSHDYKKVNFYTTVKQLLTNPHGIEKADYRGSFNLEGTYDDYWGGLGTSYELNDHFRVGISLLVAYKSLLYYNRASTALYPHAVSLPYSGWDSFGWINLWDLRILGKIGFRYELHNMSIGLNITLPSGRLFGYSHTKKETSFYNIFNNQGDPIPDYVKQESSDYVFSQVKDPFSISVGIRSQPAGGKDVYYISAEFFAGIKPYKMVDAARNGSLLFDPVKGTEYTTIYYGNRPIMNVAFGYMFEMRNNFELVFGLKTDFNSFYIPLTFYEDHPKANFFNRTASDLFHLTGGGNFIFKNRLKINAGLSFSYGRQRNNKQFINFTDIQWYVPGTNHALQGAREHNMTYTSVSIGLIVGFSYDF
jgi:hypothetical protein